MDPTEVRYRLSYWLKQSTAFERLGASVLALDGYTNVKPSQPYGGADGGKDAALTKDGLAWEMAAHCSTRDEPASDLRRKFESDLKKVAKHDPHGIAFVTNQKVTVNERNHFYSMAAETGLQLDLYDLDALEHRMSQPDAEHLRQDYLGMAPDPWPDQARSWAVEAARPYGNVSVNVRNVAMMWPILLEQDDEKMVGILVLRRGDPLNDTFATLSKLLAYPRDENRIVLLCDYGVDYQDVLEGVQEAASSIGLDATPSRFPSSATRATIYVSGPGYDSIHGTIDAAAQHITGGVGYPLLASIDVRPTPPDHSPNHP